MELDTALADYESSPSTGNRKSTPNTSSALEYSSTSLSIRHCDTRVRTRVRVQDSSPLSLVRAIDYTY
jgi:hypothetical protein